MMDRRGRLLMAALGFAGRSMPSYDRALRALRTWLDSWSDIGHVAVGMHRQGFDLQLTQYDERGWRATQRAAWGVLTVESTRPARRLSLGMDKGHCAIEEVKAPDPPKR